jgi:hypothetical protein
MLWLSGSAGTSFRVGNVPIYSSCGDCETLAGPANKTTGRRTGVRDTITAMRISRRFSVTFPPLVALVLAAVWFSARPARSQSAVRAVQDGKFRTLPSIVLSNGALELTVLKTGGALANLTLADDPDKLSPMWDPMRAAQEAGKPVRAGGTGHFLCVDGFGPVSDEERAAGLPGHGEAHRLPWKTESAAKAGNAVTLVQSVTLPLVQETYRRTVKLFDNDNVVEVRASLDSLLAFDRPICWAEHATIGSPFLEPGVTVVDMSKNQALTRPHEKGDNPNRRHRLPSAVEFDWPMAPTTDGGSVDLRAAPTALGSGDHTGHLMTPNGEYAWVTALHPEKRLLLGYIFKTSESPWLQTWESYPTEGMLARGLEFGTQTFDLPRREVVSEGKRFGAPLFRWLPAKSKIESAFLMFFVRTPEGFRGVGDVQLRDGAIEIKDHLTNQTMRIATSARL